MPRRRRAQRRVAQPAHSPDRPGEDLAGVRRARRFPERLPALTELPRDRARRSARVRARLVRWSGYLVVAALFAVACVFLSNWQFERNEERSAQIALVEQNYDAPAAPLNDIIGVDGALDPQDEWRPMILQGRYLTDAQVLVRNRPHGGTSAFEVLVPFRTDDGRVFVVD